MITVTKTKLPGVLLITPEIVRDARGEYVETYNKEMYLREGITADFIQDDISVSRKDVLRGFHGDPVTWKLISCLWGEFYLVIVQCDETKPSFGEWVSFTLSDRTKQQVLVPPMHGVAHLALTDRIIFNYKQTTYYDPSIQFSYKWDDPRFKVEWPITNPILSKRDAEGRYVD